MNLRQRYESMTIEELKSLRLHTPLTNEADNLCKDVINKKLGKNKYKVTHNYEAISRINDNSHKSDSPTSGTSWIGIIFIFIIVTIISESVKLYLKPEIGDLAKTIASKITTIKDKTALVKKLHSKLIKQCLKCPIKTLEWRALSLSTTAYNLITL